MVKQRDREEKTTTTKNPLRKHTIVLKHTERKKKKTVNTMQSYRYM